MSRLASTVAFLGMLGRDGRLRGGYSHQTAPDVLVLSNAIDRPLAGL